MIISNNSLDKLMYRFRIIITFIFISSVCLFSQTKSDSIIVKEGGWSNRYYMNGKKLSDDSLRLLLMSNPISKNIREKSLQINTWGKLVLGIGIVATGYTGYNLWKSYHAYGYAPQDQVFYLRAIAGILLDIIGIEMIMRSDRRFREAIDAYNYDITKEKSYNDNILKLYIGINGISISYSLF